MDESVELEFLKIVAETPKAFLIRLDDQQEYWIPKSVIYEVHEHEVGETEGTICIDSWFELRLEPVEKKSVFDRKAKGDHRHDAENMSD